MCSRGVLVHCPSRLAAAVAVLTIELPCGDGVFATYTLERGEPAHHCGRVMSHSFKYIRSSRYYSELKLQGRCGSRYSYVLRSTQQSVAARRA